MIKNVSEEEILLRKRARRRFIGAVTFVILSVVFLPMILDDAPQQEQQQIDIQIPSDELTAETYPWMTPENAPAIDEAEIASDPDKPLPFSDSEYSGKIESGRSTSGIPVPAKKPPFVKSTPASVRRRLCRRRCLPVTMRKYRKVHLSYNWVHFPMFPKQSSNSRISLQTESGHIPRRSGSATMK